MKAKAQDKQVQAMRKALELVLLNIKHLPAELGRPNWPYIAAKVEAALAVGE